MIKTIFRNILLVGISVLIICGLLFFALQFTGSRNDMRNALQKEAAYAEQGLMMNGTAFFDDLHLVGRITWIDAAGEILYDHIGEDPSGKAEPSRKGKERQELGGQKCHGQILPEVTSSHPFNETVRSLPGRKNEFLV